MKFKSMIRVFIALFVVSTILSGYCTATVAAKSDKSRHSSTIEVKKDKKAKKSIKAATGSSISVSGSAISVSGSAISLAVGEKQTVIVKNGMHYKVANKSIIKVNRSGKNFTITGKSVGVTSITITDKRNKVLATIEVTVTKGSKQKASDETDTDASDDTGIATSSESTSGGEAVNIESTQSTEQDAGGGNNHGRGGKSGK